MNHTNFEALAVPFSRVFEGEDCITPIPGPGEHSHIKRKLEPESRVWQMQLHPQYVGPVLEPSHWNVPTFFDYPHPFDFEVGHQFKRPKLVSVGRKKNSITPLGLKNQLLDQVEAWSREQGLDESALENLSSFETEKNQTGQQEVSKQVHKKFLVNANRFYLGSSKYKGVCWNKKKQKWRARISNHGRREFLGDWSSEVKAALIYDARVRQIYTDCADFVQRLNFPNGFEDILR